MVRSAPAPVIALPAAWLKWGSASPHASPKKSSRRLRESTFSTERLPDARSGLCADSIPPRRLRCPPARRNLVPSSLRPLAVSSASSRSSTFALAPSANDEPSGLPLFDPMTRKRSPIPCTGRGTSECASDVFRSFSAPTIHRRTPQ